MARWLVSVLFFLQVCFLVFTQDTTTISQPLQNSSSSADTTTKVQGTSTSTAVPPTRGHSKSSPMPDIIHNDLSNISTTPDTSSNANNKTEHNKKNSALSVTSCGQIVMVSMLGVLLSASAI